MKKVLIFAPTAPASGITQYILNILSQMDTKETTFDILSFHNDRLKKWTEEHGTNYFELNISMYKQFGAYKKFLMDVFSRGYDVVDFNMSSISTLTIFRYAKKCGVKRIIMHSHNSFTDLPSKLRRIVFSNLHKLLRVFANKYFDYRCACSLPAAKWMFGGKAKNAIILPNAVDTEKFAYNEGYSKEKRAQLGIDTEFVIGNIGRFTKQKNQSFLLDAFAELKKQRNDCTLVLIGDGELLNSVKGHASELGIDDSVKFVSFQEDIYKYYSMFNVLVMPSLFEGLPITAVESQANGLKLIISDTVTKECDLTDTVDFFPLEAGAKGWADKISNELKIRDFVDMSSILKEKGYSLSGQAEVISNLYFG